MTTTDWERKCAWRNSLVFFAVQILEYALGVGPKWVVVRLLLLPALERWACQGWRRCGESAVARDSDLEEKRVREKGAGTNLEYSVDVGCGDHEILTLKCLTNRVNGGVPRSHRRNYGLQKQGTRDASRVRAQVHLDVPGKHDRDAGGGMTTAETVIGVLW